MHVYYSTQTIINVRNSATCVAYTGQHWQLQSIDNFQYTSPHFHYDFDRTAVDNQPWHKSRARSDTYHKAWHGMIIDLESTQGHLPVIYPISLACTGAQKQVAYLLLPSRIYFHRIHLDPNRLALIPVSSRINIQ